MNKKIIIAVIILLAIVGLGIFYMSRPHVVIVPVNNSHSISPIGSADNIITANNQFALDLYAKYSSKQGNVFFSPYSISSALAMTYEGARGQTAQEMQNVMHFPNDITKMRSDFSSLYSKLNPANSLYKLSTANALWAQKDYSFLPDYLNLVEKNYYGKTTNLDFKTDTENSRITINNWVANQTNDKILDLIPKGIIDSMTRLVLTNAIYFKANWSQQFESESTYEQDFNLTSTQSIKAKMMHQTSNFNYMENNNLQMLEMDYLGNDLSMLVILPKDNINNLQSSINLQNLESWKKEMNPEEVQVSFPRFKFETKYLMADDLKEMGMPTAFSGLADFSGMDGAKDLYIGQVIHQAFVNVSESGTEAAAATAVVMRAMSAEPGAPSPPPKIFNANHPFIFLIQEKSTGTILFMGKVENPNI